MPSSAAAICGPCLVTILATVAAWLRLAPIVRGTLWAEDLRNFLKADVQVGLAPSLLRPYGGYLQVVPRLLAALAAHLVPVEQWAQAAALFACAASGVVAAVVFVSARQILGGSASAAAAAAITVGDPLAAHEVLGNFANLHWFVIWMTPWVLLYRPRSRRTAWLLAAIMLLGALSEFDVVLFVPLLAWRFRDHALWPVRVMFAIGCFAEVIAELIAPRQHTSHIALNGADLGEGYIINVILPIVTPVRTHLGTLLTSSGTLIGVPLAVAALVAVGYVLLRGDARQRVLAAVVAVLSPGLFISAVLLTPRAEYRYAHLTPTQLADPWLVRYGVVPSMLLLALVPLAVTASCNPQGHTGRAHRRRTIGVGVAFLALLLAVHAGPTNDQLRAHGPAFASQVIEANEDCRAAPPQARQELFAAPSSKWRLSLSCAQLAAPTVSVVLVFALKPAVARAPANDDEKRAEGDDPRQQHDSQDHSGIEKQRDHCPPPHRSHDAPRPHRIRTAAEEGTNLRLRRTRERFDFRQLRHRTEPLCRIVISRTSEKSTGALRSSQRYAPPGSRAHPTTLWRWLEVPTAPARETGRRPDRQARLIA